MFIGKTSLSWLFLYLFWKVVYFERKNIAPEDFRKGKYLFILGGNYFLLVRTPYIEKQPESHTTWLSSRTLLLFASLHTDW